MTTPEQDAAPAAGDNPLSAFPAPCPAGCPHGLDTHNPDLGCWLCDCTHGRPEPAAAAGDWETVKAAAQAQAAGLLGDLALPIEALKGRGMWPVSIAHGEPESEEQAAQLSQLHEAAEEIAQAVDGLQVRRSGGNDWSTFLFSGPGAEHAASRFLATANGLSPGWWKITCTARPQFGRR